MAQQSETKSTFQEDLEKIYYWNNDYMRKTKAESEKKNKKGKKPANATSIDQEIIVKDVNAGTIQRDAMMSASPEDESSNWIKTKAKIEDTPSEAFSNSSIDTKEVMANKRALPKHSTTYELEKFSKNMLCIFNQVYIDGYTDPREGTQQDVHTLTKTFEKFSFEVNVHTDMNKDQIFQTMDEFGNKDFTDYGCIAVVVLTHGSFDGKLRAKDDIYTEVDILKRMQVQKNPTLLTKPRLLIIQACRGTRTAQAISTRTDIRKDVDTDFEHYHLPLESDFMLLHSSYFGTTSIRETKRGSWFIQTLCDKIDTLAKTTDFYSIVNETFRKMAIEKSYEEFNRATRKWDLNKQMPVLTSTLIRQLYFKERLISIPMIPLTENDTEQRQIAIKCGTSSKNVSLAMQSECSCFLDHFNYMKNCLWQHVEENDDITAQSLLNVAEALEDGEHFNTAKQTLLVVLSNYLKSKSEEFKHLKYLHFYTQHQSTN